MKSYKDVLGLASEGLIKVLLESGKVNRIKDLLMVGEKKIEVELQPSFNGFQIKHLKNSISLVGYNVAAIITGAFYLRDQLKENSTKDVKQELLFDRRYYKKEFSLDFKGQGRTTPLINATPKYFESLIRGISQRGFNAFVIYSGYHPFEKFLDYKGLEHAIDKKTAKSRAKIFQNLKTLLSIAKQYGLITFLHHYVSHFTQELSDHLQLGLKEGMGRLAAFDHPEIDEYNRYIYRRCWQTLPELDGFFFNFESTGNAAAFLKRTLFQEVKKQGVKPYLVFRLWGVSDLKGMKEVVAAYDGPKGFLHKSHETNDVYYYPVADDRVKLWRKALPKVDFAFSMGPCHNCATNISSKGWADPAYIQALMKSMLQKGATSVSFQALFDLQTFQLEDNHCDSDFAREYSRTNMGHLDAFADVIFSKKTNASQWDQRYANYLQTSEKAASKARTALEESSQIILKQLQQFCYGSPQEGYLYPARNSYYQEPFFYYPMSFLNRIGEIKHWVNMRPWLVRSEKIQVVPNDTMAIIDYVNPAVKKKTARNPQVMVNELKSHIKKAQQFLQEYLKNAGKKKDQTFVTLVKNNINFGERTWREIEIAMALYRVYFSKNKKEFFSHLKDACAILKDLIKKVDIPLSDTFNNTTSSGPFIPEKDLSQLEHILSYEKSDFPFDALKNYLESHVIYNEIRRMSRAFASVRGDLAKRNQQLLEKAISSSDKAIAILDKNKKANIIRQNVLAWHQYLHAELRDIEPPGLICWKPNEVGINENFHLMRHDQNYRWGEKCWEDFSSFFEYQNFFREEVMDVRATYDDKGLCISLREHGIEWQQRKEMWEKNKGGVNQTGFMQIFLDVGNTGNRVEHYTLYFEGKGGTERFFSEDKDGFIEIAKPSILTDVSSTFTHNDSSWRVDVHLPWKKLGKKPKKGDQWRLNVFSNASVLRNHRVIWCQGYEMTCDVSRLGIIEFR